MHDIKSDVSIRAVRLGENAPFVRKDGNGRALTRWLFATRENLGFSPRMAVGVSKLETDCKSTLFGTVEENDREKACIVIKGIMKLSASGATGKILSYRDFAYIPPGLDYEVENVGYTDLDVAWVMSPSFESKPDSLTSGWGEPVVIRTLSEVEPVKVTIPGMERSIYRLDYAKSFRFALFTRKGHTYSPLHTHEPKDFEEGYVVLQGSLTLTDLNGSSKTLHEGDFAYVPPYGGNMNENVSDDEVHYMWCGAPAVSMKEIPVDQSLSKLQGKLSLGKEERPR